MLGLVEFINENRNKPFLWGSHDCILFANKAAHALRGRGFCDDLIGQYDGLNACRFYRKGLRAGGYKDITDAIDTRLNRLIFPSKGAIVARKMPNEFLGYRIGVCIGQKIAFVGAAGLQFEGLDTEDIAWGLE